MEEQVGAIWHRFITRLADDRYPDAAVSLSEMRVRVAILFRALGGDGGLEIEAADASAVRTRRSWLQRIAGTHGQVELAWRDDRSLRLPAHLDWFAERALNAELYLWLAALAAAAQGYPRDWLSGNQALTSHTLQRFPGLRGRYARLVEAHLATRPDAGKLAPAEAQRERVIQAALREPGSPLELPAAPGDPYPVPLWLHPAPPLAMPVCVPDPGEKGQERSGDVKQSDDERRRQAERVERPDSDAGLVAARMENFLAWGEFANVDRSQDDEDDLERAEQVAKDLDKLAIARNERAVASRLKFDLDLPSAAEDDLVLGPGILLPEWDWKLGRLRPDHCRIQPMLAIDAEACGLPPHLRRTALRLRNQFQALAPARTWQRGRQDGQEIDIDAYLRFASERAAGRTSGDRLYREMCSGERDLACLLLADLSLSTDSWIDDHRRVIDVIRDSLYLFGESLAATGDRFGMYGFSSRKRDPIRVHTLKGFDEAYGGNVRGRIHAIKPGYYTRMGAGIRYASSLLAREGAGRRLLLLLTDGKPNDLDKYEGRYGVEDTREAIREARHAGLEPFCVTIDTKGNDYLPHLFGSAGYVVIHRPSELPARLPMLYARLAG